MRKRFLLVMAVAGALVFAPGAAHAQEVTPQDAVAELDKSRVLIDESLELYEQGNTDAAYTAARNAYLDHFEYVEIPLRVRDEALTLELEEDYATLRNLIEDEAPIDEIEKVAGELRHGLDRVERRLSEVGVVAPLLAFTSAFIILFREGFEAVLVVAAVLGYLEASRNTQYKGAVLKGVGAAVVASIVLYVLATLFLRIAPLQRELLEAGTAVLAVIMLFYVSFWLISRLEHRRWMEFVKAKVWAAATTGSALALAGVGFTAVFREGFETVLFYQALLSFAEGLQTWVGLGTLAGFVVLAGLGYLIFKAGRKIPVKAFLGTAVVLIMALSVAFIGNAVRALQQAAVVSVTFLEEFPRLPIFLADLTGWHPTRESLVAQAVLASIYILGAVWTFVVLPRREARRKSASPEVEPATESGQEKVTSAT
ncbi:MAG: FTR1 family protein [Actinomycetota bacterium]|nr:FTR1 family protein [Actinomycetota bacterium]